MSEKRKCKFTKLLEVNYPCFNIGRDPYEAYCKLCDCYISVANKGKLDLERHIRSDKHVKHSVQVQTHFQNSTDNNFENSVCESAEASLTGDYLNAQAINQALAVVQDLSATRDLENQDLQQNPENLRSSCENPIQKKQKLERPTLRSLMKKRQMSVWLSTSERKAQALERIATALEDISGHLSMIAAGHSTVTKE